MKKNTITKDEIKKIAKLANLELTDREIILFSKQLSEVIDYNYQKLQQVKTDNIEPLLNVSGLTSVFREDLPEPGLNQNEAITNTKSTHDGFFKVKAVLEND